MALLLDTQIIIWLESDKRKIPATISDAISQASEVFFSKVSIWEMSIKLSIGKLELNQSLQTFTRNFSQDYGFHLLEIDLQHIYASQFLPVHHRDPFDRLLIAQSLTEKMPIVSSDELFDLYQVHRIWK